MISVYKQNDNISARVTEFVCDTVTDIANLPTDEVFPGSTALVTENSSVYMLSANREWVQL